jgi:hypothetical protein
MSSSPTATILRGPNVLSNREAVKAMVLSAAAAGRYYEYGGGLGDVICAATQSDLFACLDSGSSGPIVVTLFCHNSFAWELLAFHPSAGSMVILDIPYREAQEAGFRKRYGLPDQGPPRRHMLYADGVLRFYAPEEDGMILRALPQKRAVLATTASLGATDQRTIPAALSADICRTLLGAGITPVLVGRTYKINGSEVAQHVDALPPAVEGLVNLTDLLTVPGVLELVRTSPITVACDSAVSCGAHSLMRPTFSLVSESHWRACGGDPAGHGRVLHDLFYQSTFKSYREELLIDFLRKHVP